MEPCRSSRSMLACSNASWHMWYSLTFSWEVQTLLIHSSFRKTTSSSTQPWPTPWPPLSKQHISCRLETQLETPSSLVTARIHTCSDKHLLESMAFSSGTSTTSISLIALWFSCNNQSQINLPSILKQDLHCSLLFGYLLELCGVITSRRTVSPRKTKSIKEFLNKEWEWQVLKTLIFQTKTWWNKDKKWLLLTQILRTWT